MFRYVVLGLLRDGVPRHGYALMKAYRDRIGVKVSTGNFYRELQRLVSEGLVRAATRGIGGDPRQAPYQITDRGSEEFANWFADPRAGASNGSHEDHLSACVLFLADVHSDVAHKVLKQWQDDLWLRAKLLERSRESALTATADADGFPVLPLLLGRRLRHVAADLDFLEQVRTTYEEWLARQPRSIPSSVPVEAASGSGSLLPRRAGRNGPA